MRSRLLLLSGIGILLISGIVYVISTNAQSWTQNVSLGDAAFFPSSLTLTGTSELKVSIATGTLVPAIGVDNNTPIKAIVQITESSNFSGISYSVDPFTQLIKVPLAGGGRSSTGTFEFTIASNNTKTGNIAYRASLIGLENNQPGITTSAPTTKDITLAVAAPTPTPSPTPPQTVEECHSIGWYWNYWEGGTCTQQPTCQLMPEPCAPGTSWSFEWCECVPNYGSPVLVDVAGDGFRLTGVEGGVRFDLDAEGVIRERVAWTAAGSDDAFLFLDRNEDGVVNNGTELFGDVTPQPYSPYPNGFVALRMYDVAVHGGNGDGVIDALDAVYWQLRLWRDANHNGLSEPGELQTLPALDVSALHLDYKESKRTDEFGNQFRFRAKVDDARGAKVGRWAWDVFLLSQ